MTSLAQIANEITAQNIQKKVQKALVRCLTNGEAVTLVLDFENLTSSRRVLDHGPILGGLITGVSPITDSFFGQWEAALKITISALDDVPYGTALNIAASRMAGVPLRGVVVVTAAKL